MSLPKHSRSIPRTSRLYVWACWNSAVRNDSDPLSTLLHILWPLEHASKVGMSCSSPALAKISTVLKCSRLLGHCYFPLSQAIPFISSGWRTCFSSLSLLLMSTLNFHHPLRDMIWKSLLYITHFYMGLLFHSSFFPNHSFVARNFFYYNTTHWKYIALLNTLCSIFFLSMASVLIY